MSFQVRTENRETKLVTDTVVVLENKALGERAEISVALGFNCFRWAARQETVELLYADPNFHNGSSPTRTGIPILFPFPNRIRDGLFSWDGNDYQLTPNDPSGKNAIHGFACRRPWRLLEIGASVDSCWVTGEFHGCKDAADCKELWPTDYRIRVTYRLASNRLILEAKVDNPDSKIMPFGLGYHPYYRTGTLADNQETLIQVPAQGYWELTENLPTGVIQPVEGPRDLTQPKRFDDLVLDDVLTKMSDQNRNAEGLHLFGSIQRGKQLELRVFASGEFRDVVVFTPPHREAFAIEPYTCTTDAINLQQKGIEAGLLTLSPGQTWSSVVENVIHFKA